MKNSMLFILLFAFACTKEDPQADAYGNFEANTTTVSAQANGALVMFDVQEGQSIEAGQLVGVIDSTTLYLQKLQLLASLQTLGQKTQDPQPQIDVLKEQQKSLLREKKRLEALVADKAATPKQLDDLNAQLDVIGKQIEAAQRQAGRVNQGILSEGNPLKAQVNVLESQLRKCYIYNPIKGVVLTKIAEPGEVAGFGAPLYRIANLDTLILRAYASGGQLSAIKIGQKVEVKVDVPGGASAPVQGVITWISNQSEFTPKSIQTREERANLVYALKIAVPNKDGKLKIGMPAEVNFTNAPTNAKQ